MKSFGVDAEWIPGEERRHRLKMTVMREMMLFIGT